MPGSPPPALLMAGGLAPPDLLTAGRPGQAAGHQKYDGTGPSVIREAAGGQAGLPAISKADGTRLPAIRNLMAAGCQPSDF